MTPDRWHRIEELYHCALKLEQKQRGAFLDGACAGDEALRREVESLLVQGQQAEGSTETLAMEVPAQIADDRACSMVGRHIGAYEVVSRVGAGGMGEVYQARDTRLKRTVAIKVLPRDKTSDPERKRRFVQEARAASALNHPNIITIHDIGSEDGVDFVVMEYVAGKTLEQLIPRHGLKLKKLTEVLQTSIQIADALAKAHSAGIIHRDLKPGNVMLTGDGLVKVLDFGLAELTEPTGSEENDSAASTGVETEPGKLLGTVSYMSPEQAEGRVVDARSDIFAFGALLYEMVTGQRAFQGDSAASTLAAVLHKDPKPASKLNRVVPQELEKIINRCLRKDRERRFQTMADLKVMLQDLKEESESGAVAGTDPALGPFQRLGKPSPWRVALIVASALVGGIVGGSAVWMKLPRGKSDLPLRRFTIRPPVSINPPTYYNPAVAISPNGRHIAFAQTETGLWIQDLDQPSARLLSGTRGVESPFWSPDSEMVGYVTDNLIMKVPAKGGHPVRVCDLPARGYGGAWHPTGEFIAAGIGDPSELYIVPTTTGGVPKLLLSKEAAAAATSLTLDRVPGYFFGPHFLPPGGGSLLAYSIGYLNPNLMLQDLGSGKVEFLDRGMMPFYAAPGYLIYMRPVTNDLWALPISAGSLKAGGEAFRVAANGIYPSVSNDGTLVYLDSPFQQLAWFDRAGKRVELVGEPTQAVYYAAISPGGRQIAAETLENGNHDVWVWDVHRGSRVRLTADDATDILPTWSPNGDEVMYGSYRTGSIDIWLRRADGGTEERLLFGSAQNERVTDWSKDGQYILYTVITLQEGRPDLAYLVRRSDGKWEPRSYRKTAAAEGGAKLSPDGLHVAYLSDESGRMELYVGEFPRGERKWAISTNGATHVRWSRDGKEIFYSENGTLFAVPVKTSPEFSAGPAVRLFAHPSFGRVGLDPHYDVSADRQRILLPETVGGNERLIHVVQNWLGEFRDPR